ncbi:hypothetical protein WN51_01617 [Melipona quadrifasciata]|uniref:Uncharacterized protein n=1 Tax=Melipona quadrifasciata TaxID=166423 RepID=A0A0N0U456_9HYME|nr:hypothetical protein WN51_01617 [Melipona quadrifasciata]
MIHGTTMFIGNNINNTKSGFIGIKRYATGRAYLGSLNAILGSKNGGEPETGPINVLGRSESFSARHPTGSLKSHRYRGHYSDIRYTYMVFIFCSIDSCLLGVFSSDDFGGTKIHVECTNT